ncbi:MAG TPA: carboxylating nicotinate-nucleotide diphosphorylase [Gammaproteobacteria bacterium]|nr:carboxylating nicotinate-nucleotide diphosphorylase [Gammaproteobacteria bacterium]
MPNDLSQSVSTALNEDIGSGDITAKLIPSNTTAKCRVICRETAVIAGCAWFEEAFKQVDSSVNIQWHIADGSAVTANTGLCEIEGNARSLLTAERTALNFLQTLSATATQTHRYVNAVSHTATRILDTRKTLPGLRNAQKYAVLCGGGHNHRKGLYDAILIKENHIMAAGSIINAVSQAKALNGQVKIEVEVENLDELKQALSACADIILLDNMALGALKNAVSINQGRAKLEASGGVSLKTIRAIAETGVDYISIGDLTKNIQAIDLSMRFHNQETL